MEITHRARIETGSSGTVTLRMIGQETTLTLFQNSSATVPRRFGNDTALILDRGSLEADVAKQKKGERFALSSQLARVSVIGTRFTFGADPELSSVNVSEGTVDMRSLSGKGGKVPAGSGMHVTADSLTRFGDMEWRKVTQGRLQRASDSKKPILPLVNGFSMPNLWLKSWGRP